MNIATLTPTRGDRPELFNFCREQIEAQTVQPTDKYFIAFQPTDRQPDITKRIKNGYELAKQHGMEWVIILEDDDSYRQDHIERYSRFMDRYDFIGDQNSLYYNIRDKRYRVFKHPRRASLFTTAFRVSALDKFRWPPDNTVFLDIKLWQFAKTKRCKFVDSGAVGIKAHGFGMRGGKGHIMNLPHEDPALLFLKSVTTKQNFDFYSELIKRL
jgi:hypothetical protein